VKSLSRACRGNPGERRDVSRVFATHLSRVWLASLSSPGLEILCPARLSPDFHIPQRSAKIALSQHRLSRAAKTRAAPAFYAKSIRPAAQNPVTRLWTPRTRLKIRILRMHVFH
jgi:hypothetical protein